MGAMASIIGKKRRERRGERSEKRIAVEGSKGGRVARPTFCTRGRNQGPARVRVSPRLPCIGAPFLAADLHGKSSPPGPSDARQLQAVYKRSYRSNRKSTSEGA